MKAGVLLRAQRTAVHVPCARAVHAAVASAGLQWCRLHAAVVGRGCGSGCWSRVLVAARSAAGRGVCSAQQAHRVRRCLYIPRGGQWRRIHCGTRRLIPAVSGTHARTRSRTHPCALHPGCSKVAAPSLRQALPLPACRRQHSPLLMMRGRSNTCVFTCVVCAGMYCEALLR
jgi:hypothetical protein